MPGYEIFCVIENISGPFSVDVTADVTISNLKRRIKDQNANILRDVDAIQLKLWRVEIPDDQEIDFSSLAPEDELKPTRRINRYWEATPPEEHVHVLVKPPAGKYLVSYLYFHRS